MESQPRRNLEKAEEVMQVKIVGGGLAGSECAWQLIKQKIAVTIFEMRPQVETKAHKTGLFAELVCSNSFRGAALTNAVGLLKQELILLDSLVMKTALACQVPAGGCLAVDRELFSTAIDRALREHPLVTVETCEVSELPEPTAGQPVVIATGPLTAKPLTLAIRKLTGQAGLAFFDAVSPIIFSDSIDQSKVFRQSRYDKGNGQDYLNIPLDKDQYYQFVSAVTAAEKYTGNQLVESDSLEELKPFEGCMPIEDMIERGPDTLRFGPLKPKGLTDPVTGKQPYAVIQLRQDNREATLWSMVGFQTRMKRADQEAVFRSLPGLAKAEFARFGSVHRNTFINSPACLSAINEFRTIPNLFFAGQITGVEGYVESTASGLVTGINVARRLRGLPDLIFPPATAIGALLNYISDPDRKDFQPMNINFGLLSSFSEDLQNSKKEAKQAKRLRIAEQALKLISDLL